MDALKEYKSKNKGSTYLDWKESYDDGKTSQNFLQGQWNPVKPGQYLSPVTNSADPESDYQSALPEIEIRANEITPQTDSQRMNEAMTDIDKGIMRSAWSAAQWTPLGDPQMAADVYTDVKDQNYGSLAMTAGMLAMPSLLRKPIKAIGRQINKGIKWAKAPWRAKELYSQARHITPNEIRNIPPSRIDAIEKDLTRIYGADVWPPKENKRKFINEYKYRQMIDKASLEGVGLDQASLDLFKQDPAYAKYVLDNHLHPLDENTVQSFIKRQQSATRGVFSQKVGADITDVESMLTYTKEGRTGGDRLGTGSGIYTSNSYDLAKRFSKTLGSNYSGTSVVAKVNLDFGIDPTASFSQRLAQARRQIYPHDLHAAAGKVEASSEKLLKGGYKAKESMYTTRSGDKLGNVYERAVLGPNEPTKRLDISEMETSYDIHDTRGRWGADVEAAPGDTDLFIPRKIGNSFGDFIREAKVFFEPIPNSQKALARDGSGYQEKENIARRIIEGSVGRTDKLKPLMYRSYRLDNKFQIAKQASGITLGAGIIGGAAYGVTKMPKWANERDHEGRVGSLTELINSGKASERVTHLINMAKQAEKRGDSDQVREYYYDAWNEHSQGLKKKRYK